MSTETARFLLHRLCSNYLTLVQIDRKLYSVSEIKMQQYSTKDVMCFKGSTRTKRCKCSAQDVFLKDARRKEQICQVTIFFSCSERFHDVNQNFLFDNFKLLHMMIRGILNFVLFGVLKMEN